MTDRNPEHPPGHPTQGSVHYSVGTFSLEAQWDVAAGQVMVLFGASGAGKSTMLRLIAGLLRPASGRIEIGGRAVYNSGTGAWLPAHRRNIGYLTQQYHLFPHLRVDQNIGYGLTALPRDERGGRVRQWLSSLHLEGLERRWPWELSGGQRQRVALARALAPGPDLLLLDEPFSSLDAELRRVLRGELRSMLAQRGIPVILVTHDREEALAIGDLVQVIDQGRSVAEGTPVEVLGQPGQGRVARLVGVENLLELTVESRNPVDGTMVCTGGGLRLEVPLDEPASPTGLGVQATATSPTTFGDRVRVGIRAKDIILAEDDPHGMSARNRIQGTVTEVEARPPGYTVTLDCGLSLQCHITRASLAEMEITLGRRLWAVFKASSCFLVQE